MKKPMINLSALRVALEQLSTGVIPDKKTGICNNVGAILKETVSMAEALDTREYLKEMFKDLGYNSDFPVEFKLLKNISAAKLEYYEGIRKWDAKTKFGKCRQELVFELILLIDKK